MEILILGSGFAGTRAAKILEDNIPAQAARLTLVNKENFILYTPFLPEAAAGTLEPRHVVTPLREVLQRTHIRVGDAFAHDPSKQEVVYRSKNGYEKTLAYDRLLVSLGSVSRILPIPGLAEHAMTFKSLYDSIYLRNTVIERLEEANSLDDKDKIEELLTFVFVGAGYAGLEAIAELQDFASQAIRSYPLARLQGMRWILLDSGKRVLQEIDESLSRYAASELRSRGIEIYTETTLDRATDDAVFLSDGSRIATSNLVWTAGVSPNPRLRDFSLPLNERGEVITNLFLNVKGQKNIWSVGDCAEIYNKKGHRQPPTAQHALRQADVAAHNILQSIDLRKERREYTYSSRNAFVNLGRYKAVGRVGHLRFSGALAWWMARTYHLMQIPGRSRKIRAVLDWSVGLFFQRDLAELGSLREKRSLANGKKLKEKL
jgi:NADH dehydrogenase